MLDFETLSVQDLNNTGVALCADGNFDQGIVLLRKAQAARPNDPDLCCSLGNALGEHGDFDAARHYLNRSLYLDPEHQPALTILGKLPASTYEIDDVADRALVFQPVIEAEPLLDFETVELQDTQAYVDYSPTTDSPFATEVLLEPNEQSIPEVPPPGKAEVIETLIVKPAGAPNSAAPRPQPAQVVKPRRKFSWFLPVGTLVILLDVFGIWHYINRGPKPHPVSTPVLVHHESHFYTIAQTLPDTQANRSLLLNRIWKTPAASYAPVSARMLTYYYEIVAKNKSGESVGARATDGTLQAFSVSGKIAVDLGDLPKDTESGAISINDNGLIVGYSGKTKYRAVLWNNKKTVDLNTLLLPASTTVLRKAVNIDNQGDIVATATDPKGKLLIVSLKPHS